MAKGKICDYCGSDNNVREFNNTGKSYCSKHYAQLWKYGEIFERTKFDKNEIIIRDNCAEICMYNKEHKEVAKAIIDIDDVERCKEYKWYLCNIGYPSTHIGKKLIHLHKFLIPDANAVIDHINRNSLDNRKENLRITTFLGNSQNKTFKEAVGVRYLPKTNRWRATYCYNGKLYNLGVYDSFDLAMKVRLLYEKECIGENISSQRHLFSQYLRDDDKLEQYMVLHQKSEKQSGVKGVTWSEKDNRWRVRHDSKILGYYTDVDDAIRCRLLYEKENFNNNAPQQFLFEQYGIT